MSQLNFEHNKTEAGALLKAARTSQVPKLTIEGLARHLGVGKRVVSAWEAGEYKPSLEHKIELSRLLNLDIAGVPPGITSAPTIEPLRGSPANSTELTLKLDMATRLIAEVKYALHAVSLHAQQ